jgi:hypothetical protein
VNPALRPVPGGRQTGGRAAPTRNDPQGSCTAGLSPEIGADRAQCASTGLPVHREDEQDAALPAPGAWVPREAPESDRDDVEEVAHWTASRFPRMNAIVPSEPAFFPAA